MWVRGPVLKDIFIELSEEPQELLKDYIKKADYDNTIFEAKADFCDDEFSDNDIDIMNLVIKFAQNKNAKDLVNHTHDDNSLWKKSAIKNGVYDDLIKEKIRSTEHIIDFSLLFSEENFLREKYENAKENLEFVKYIKG